jgi:RNA polymerase subunit RPABC4/transcription elongation factor Spt4
MEPNLKQCRQCGGSCSEKMDKCPICYFYFKLKWFEFSHDSPFHFLCSEEPMKSENGIAEEWVNEGMCAINDPNKMRN